MSSEMSGVAATAATSARPRRWWMALLLLVGLAALAWVMTRYAADKPAAHSTPPAANRGAPPVPVTVAAVQTGDIPVTLSAIGTVSAFNTVSVKSRVDGQLNKLFFQEGQFVHQGDLLAEIDPRPFQVQLAQAEGQLARDSAQLKAAQLMLQRDRELLARQFIARQDVDNQTATVGQYEGSIKADQALIENATLQLTYSRITAPISGRVGLRLVDSGNMVHANDSSGLVSITQVQPIAVVFPIPEDSLAAVLDKLRSGVALPVEAYDRNGEKLLASGTLLATDNQIDRSTGTARLKAVFENTDNSLFPNQFVNVRLLLDRVQNATVVALAAIQRGPDGTFVYLVKGDQTVEVRPVVLGPQTAGAAAVQSGLQPGDSVVVDGVDKLRPGSAVQVKRGEPQKSAARPPA